MAVFTRAFTLREKVLILFLSILLVMLVYYRFVHLPVEESIEASHARRNALQEDLDVAESRLAQLVAMRTELDDDADRGLMASRMPSYSYKKQEYDFLDGVLRQTADYYIGFSGLQRDGEVVRRSFTLRYETDTIQEAEAVIKELEDSEIRCLIGNVTMSPIQQRSEDGQGRDIFSLPVRVDTVATFYETTWDGAEDRELPADRSS